MKSSVRVHAALLVGALVASYFVWTREPSSAKEDEVTIASFKQLDRVLYEEPDRKVSLARREDDKGAYYWVTVDKMERPPRKLKAPRMPRRAPATVKQPIKGPQAKSKLGQPKRSPPRKPRLKVTPLKKGAAKKAPAKKAPAKPAAKKPAAKNPLARDPKAAPPPKKAPAKKAPAKKAPAKNAPTKPAVKVTPAKAQPPAKAPPAGAKSPFGAPASQPVSKLTKPKKPPQLPKVRKLEAFKGNKSAEELVKRLASFSAFRSLGQPGEKELEKYGLSKSKTTLTLVSGSTKRVFVLGDKTYGNSDRYVMDKQDKRVYVIRPRALQDLRYAEYRLLDRNLLDFEPGEIDRATISAKGETKVVVQHNRRDRRNAFWNKEGGPKKRNDLYQTWVTKLLRLKAVKYVKDDELKATELEEMFKVELALGGKQKGWLKVLRGKKTTPPLTAKQPLKQQMDYYAISDNTRVRVTLSRSRADELARDLSSIFKD